MWYVQAAFLSEGVTDDRFIPTLLTRSLDMLCLTEFEAPVEFSDVVPLRARKGPAPIAELVSLCQENQASFNLFFFHHDSGSRDLMRVTREWLEPFRKEWERVGIERALVEVVPVRETEAWALTSGDSLRRALGVSFSDEKLGIPSNPKDVEKVSDPKALITAAVGELSGPPVDAYARLGETVDLEILKLVPSYQEMISQLRVALIHLGMKPT